MKKVLVVDDQQDVLDTIEVYLEERNDLEVTSIDDSVKALEIIKNQHFDLLITDILMPEINGIELIDKVRGIKPSLKIIACSGGGDSGSIVAGLALDQALNEGAGVALLKPFTQEELLARIEMLLGKV